MSTPEIVRPEIVTDEMLEYLDHLRDEGSLNMYGAAPYIENAFEVTRRQSHEIVGYWMKSFAQRHPS